MTKTQLQRCGIEWFKQWVKLDCTNILLRNAAVIPVEPNYRFYFDDSIEVLYIKYLHEDSDDSEPIKGGITVPDVGVVHQMFDSAAIIMVTK